jgi:Arc/MetJ family transcription regulator
VENTAEIACAAVHQNSKFKWLQVPAKQSKANLSRKTRVQFRVFFREEFRLEPYEHGTIVWMKKTLHIDESLLRDAKAASGAKTDTDTVKLGLEALVRRGAYERLRALRGSEPHAREIRRRRERASSAKHSSA